MGKRRKAGDSVRPEADERPPRAKPKRANREKSPQGRTSIGLKLLFALLLATVLPVIALRWIDPPISAFMVRSAIHAWWEGRADYRWRYRWVNWEQISTHAKLAVIAAEDQRFPEHSGFDIKAISNAWDNNQHSKRLHGASTITQQTAKNLFLWPGRSYLRKGIEAYFTALIELFWPKRRILEVYLNVAEFGDGIYGVAAAGETFFRKSPATLTPAEATRLAAVLPNPIRFNAVRPSAYVQTRQRWILKQMRSLGGADYLRRL